MFKKFCGLVVMIAGLIFLPYLIVTYMKEDLVKTDVSVTSNDEVLKEYCIWELANEVSSDYEDEMLKVQAILVRTTIYKEVEELGIEFLDNKTTQENELDFLWKQRLEKAWDDTEGQVVMYEEKLALVPFHQVSNGKTRNGAEVLGSEEYPYLQVVECPRDVEAENQIENVFVPLTGISIEEWDSAGYVTSISIGDEKINGEIFRDTNQLASSCFEVQAFENRTRIITKGVGHGLGLSQYTANEMAKEGKSAEEILQFFFPGTEIKEVAEILWNIE